MKTKYWIAAYACIGMAFITAPKADEHHSPKEQKARWVKADIDFKLAPQTSAKAVPVCINGLLNLKFTILHAPTLKESTASVPVWERDRYGKLPNRRARCVKSILL